MNISLDLRDVPGSVLADLGLDIADEDPLAFIIAACERLADDGRATFAVSGFGDDRWPVDVWADLSVLLEQLPAALTAAASGAAEFALDFYEQGVERRVDFRRAGEVYVMRCVSSLDWQPADGEEPIRRDTLVDMLDAVLAEFAALLDRATLAPPVRRAFDVWASRASVRLERSET